LAESETVSTQAPLQLTVPGGHEHAPLMQTSPDGQTWPQAPQFAKSVWTLVHTPLQLVSPAWHVSVH
jgi:hypothetical protein